MPLTKLPALAAAAAAELCASPTMQSAAEHTLVTDNVRFSIEDSNDSLHQFMHPGDSMDDSDSIEWHLNSATPCRALKFSSSPSEPVTRCPSLEPHQGQSLQKLQSAPAFRPQKRVSPDPLSQGPCLKKAQGAKPGTPKRARLGPLSDMSNRQLGTESSPQLGHLVTSSSKRPTTFKPTLHRCASECVGSQRLDSTKIDNAIASIDSLNLVGNSQDQHSLPTVKELNFGIRYVTPRTVSQLLKGELKSGFAYNYKIIDCRYPYEYEGGHIQGAENIFTPDDLMKQVVEKPQSGRTVLIFHCEFSSERAPKLAKFLRQKDRDINSLNYPQLLFPEVYVLQGGYKKFYEFHLSQCTPQKYTRMADPAHQTELSKWQKFSRALERQTSQTRHSQREQLARLQRL